MLALTAILTFQILFALSCLLFFLFLITIYVFRRPGHLTTSDHLFNPRRWKFKAIPPPLHPSSLQQGDLESNPQPTTTYYNPFDSNLTTSSRDSSATECCSSADTQRSGNNYPETPFTTKPITWRDPWRWRFGTGEEESRGRGNGGEEEARRIGVESPGPSPLGLGKYFFESGVGLRDM